MLWCSNVWFTPSFSSFFPSSPAVPPPCRLLSPAVRQAGLAGLGRPAPQDLAGKFSFGPPMGPCSTVVFPKQAGGIVRAGGRGTAQPVLLLGVTTRHFFPYRKESAKLRVAVCSTQ